MTLEHLPLIMLRAFALTVLVECAAAWCLGVRDCYSQIIVILANLMTNPLVVSGGAVVIVQIGYGALLPAMLVFECMAVMAEGFVYSKKLSVKCNSFLLSLLCNTSSYMIGELLNRFVY